MTIIPRGMALGVTMYSARRDRLSRHQESICFGQIAMSMGGRIAEDIFIGSITTGAANDIEKQPRSLVRWFANTECLSSAR